MMLQKMDDGSASGGARDTEKVDDAVHDNEQTAKVPESAGSSHAPDNEPKLLHRSLRSRPHNVVSASGMYLTLSSGRRIMDGCAGAAVSVIGHGHPDITAAVVAQMQRVSYVHTLTYTTDSAEALADELLRGRPYGLSRAYFVGSGSEATDSALKLARQFHVENGQPQRTRWVARRQAYHGNTAGAMSVGSFVARKAPYVGALLLENVSYVSPAYAYRGQHDGETEDEYATRLAEELEAEFQRLGPDTVAAFFAETVGGATAGCITPPRGYFEKVRRVCDRHGVLLVLDEVMCGSGRTGTYFAFEQDGDVRPDLVTLGKGVGGGYAPIAGVLVHEKIVDVLRRGTGSFNHGHTYQSHAVSCAAALAVHRVITREKLIPACARKGAVLEQLLRETFEHEPHVGNIRGRGLFWGIEFVRDKPSKEPFEPAVMFGPRVQERAFELGLAVYPGRGTADGDKGDHVIVSPPLIIEDEEIRELVRVLKRAYDDVVEAVVGH